ncbi:hypothetical protein M0R19_08040 [Candidatus Pacearchaeota archaeon]|jgi:uncharacterized protein YbaR (Trm112 family)|nr:hypothetical protein [Candidatus Pacearchaeota archaeon]
MFTFEFKGKDTDILGDLTISLDVQLRNPERHDYNVVKQSIQILMKRLQKMILRIIIKNGMRKMSYNLLETKRCPDCKGKLLIANEKLIPEAEWFCPTCKFFFDNELEIIEED